MEKVESCNDILIFRCRQGCKCPRLFPNGSIVYQYLIVFFLFWLLALSAITGQVCSHRVSLCHWYKPRQAVCFDDVNANQTFVSWHYLHRLRLPSFADYTMLWAGTSCVHQSCCNPIQWAACTKPAVPKPHTHTRESSNKVLLHDLLLNGLRFFLL